MLTEGRRAREPDDGSILPIIIGYTVIAVVLVVVGIDVSKVFLARRALESAADTAALVAAQGVDTRAVYRDGGLRCGQPLPLAPQRAADLAEGSARDDTRDLLHLFATVDAARTRVSQDTVDVELSGKVAVPFGRVLSWLDPSRPDGEVRVTATAHARSPVVGVGGCG